MTQLQGSDGALSTSVAQNSLADGLVCLHVQQMAGQSLLEHVAPYCFPIVHCHPLLLHCQLGQGHYALGPCIRQSLNSLPIVRPGLIPWVPLGHHLQGQTRQSSALLHSWRNCDGRSAKALRE